MAKHFAKPVNVASSLSSDVTSSWTVRADIQITPKWEDGKTFGAPWASTSLGNCGGFSRIPFVSVMVFPAGKPSQVWAMLSPWNWLVKTNQGKWVCESCFHRWWLVDYSSVSLFSLEKMNPWSSFCNVSFYCIFIEIVFTSDTCSFQQMIKCVRAYDGKPRSPLPFYTNPRGKDSFCYFYCSIFGRRPLQLHEGLTPLFPDIRTLDVFTQHCLSSLQ